MAEIGGETMKKLTIAEQLDRILYEIRCIRFTMEGMSSEEITESQKEATALECQAERLAPRARGDKNWVNAILADIRIESHSVRIFLPK